MSVKKAIGIALLIVLVPPIFFGFFFSIPYIASSHQPDPPRPEITYGEFPFRIEYEINGEMVVIEDAVICEFDGFQPDWGGGDKTRKWKVSFASGNKSHIFKISAYVLADETNQVYFACGSGAYYMGDTREYALRLHAYKATKSFIGGWRFTDIEPDELLDAYGIRVISYEFSPPIVNSFK